MMSPGSRVIERLMNSISSATPQIMSAVVLSCIRISAPSSGPDPGQPPRPEPERLRVGDLVGGDEAPEPIGRNVSEPLARSHWPSPTSPSPSAAGTPCQSRALMSLTHEIAGDVVERVRARRPAAPRVPMTTPSSTSRSRAWVPSGRTIGSPSPMTVLANFENSSGRVGQRPAALGGVGSR